MGFLLTCWPAVGSRIVSRLLHITSLRGTRSQVEAARGNLPPILEPICREKPSRRCLSLSLFILQDDRSLAGRRQRHQQQVLLRLLPRHPAHACGLAGAAARKILQSRAPSKPQDCSSSRSSNQQLEPLPDEAQGLKDLLLSAPSQQQRSRFSFLKLKRVVVPPSRSRPSSTRPTP